VGVAVGADRMLVQVDAGSNTLARSFELGAFPHGVAVGEDGAVWLSLQGT